MALNITNKDYHLEIEDTVADSIDFIGKNLKKPKYEQGSLLIRGIDDDRQYLRIKDIADVGTVSDDVNGDPTAPTTVKELATTIAAFFFA